VTYKMEMVWLLDNGFIARQTLELRLADESRLKQDLYISINRGEAYPMALPDQAIPDFFDRWMPLGVEQRAPNERPLRRVLEMLLRQPLLQFVTMYHFFEAAR